MIIVLFMKNELAFVDGTISKPPIDSLCNASWYIFNSMVISWLQNSLRHHIDESVLFLRTAHDI